MVRAIRAVYSVRMSKLMLLAALGAASSPSTHASERRCGWLSNPTPANWYLIDRKGEWVIGEQGQYQIPDKSWDVMPDMTTRGWVKTNGHYGYGCVCMTVRVDQRTMRVLEILSAKPIPLHQCRQDRRLRKP